MMGTESRRGRRLVAVGIIAAFITGVAVGVAGPRLFEQRISTDWKPAAINDHFFGEEEQDAALFVDVPAPNIKEFSGRVKFIDNVYHAPQDPEFGYELSVTLPDIARDKVPDQYKHPQKEVISDIPVTISPPKHFYYSILFHFVFHDKDGFELLTLDSDPNDDLVTGGVSRFKAKLGKRVPYNIAVHTTSVSVVPDILKCVTCTKSGLTDQN